MPMPVAIELPMVERKTGSEGSHLLPDQGGGAFVRDVVEHLRDQGADLAHFRLLESARSHRRRTQPYAARVQGRIRVERDGILVDRDAGAVERLLRFLTANAFGEHIQQHHVRVRAARHYAEPGIHQALGQGPCVGYHLLLILRKMRLHSLQEAHGLGCHHVNQRTPLYTWENGLIEILGVFLLGQNDAGARAAQGFVRSGSDDVGVLARIGVQARRHQAGNVRHVYQEDGSYGIGDLPETREVEDSREQALAPAMIIFGLMFVGQPFDFVVVDTFVLFADAVRHYFISLAGEVELVTVGEVTAVRQIEAHDGVAGRKHGAVGRLVGLRAGMRLDVGVLGAKELLGSITSQVLDDVGILAAAVVAFAGIPFGVLVGEDAADGFQDRFRREVLAGDQARMPSGVLAFHLVLDGFVDFGIDFGQGPRHFICCQS